MRMAKSAVLAWGDLNRLRQIVSTLARHGLGGFLGRLKLNRSSWFGGEGRPADHVAMSTARRFRLAFEELGPTFIKLG